MRIGVNTFGLAEAMSRDFEGSLEKLKTSGITDIEPVILCSDTKGIPDDACEEQLAAIHKNGGWWLPAYVERKISAVRKHGLHVEGAHLMQMPEKPEKIREMIPGLVLLAEKCRIKFYVVSLQAGSRAAVRTVSGAYRELAEALAAAGTELLYHNHKQEFTLEDGREILEWILEEIPEMNLELDVGWARFAGCDAAGTLEKYKDRLRVIHMKDIMEGACEENEADCFTAVGEGCIPLGRIMEEAENLRLYENCGIIIDQDKSCGDILADTAAGVKNIMREGSGIK